MNSDPKNNIIELHIDITQDHIDQKLSALEILVNQSQLSKQKLKDAMSKGAVWLSRTHDSTTAKPIRRKNVKLALANQLHLYYNPSVLQYSPDSPILISDEKDYSVWDKPYGVWSHGTKWGDHSSIGRLVEKHFDYARQSYLVHRLDRAANGLIIIAHNKKVARLLSDRFADRQVDKVYQARVQGHFQFEQTIDQAIDDKTAISHVSLIYYDESQNQSMLKVQIETGRKHQIRKHLASVGFPIIGDRLYGNGKEQDLDLQLTAFELRFVCPITKERKHYQITR